MTVALLKKLDDRKNTFLYRTRQITHSSVLSFASNDYLGLSHHEEVIKAFKKGADTYGVGSGASALLGGFTKAHQALEEELAEFLHYPRALVFSSGYMANIGILTALLTSIDRLYEDRLNHASLIEGGLFSKAKCYRYRHLDIQHLQHLLVSSQQQANRNVGQPWIITEGVFSMDGDIAPLKALTNVVKQNQASILVDDAHGIGFLGELGRGSIEHFQLSSKDITLLVGTFGKAFGGQGAFVVGNEVMVETFIQFAKPYIYTTALSPAIAEAMRVSLRLIQKESWRRQHCQSLIARFKKGAEQLGLELLPSITPIQPLMIRDPQSALRISANLNAKGILVGAVRSPTVPKGTDRLRINIRADHQEQHIDYLLENLICV